MDFETMEMHVAHFTLENASQTKAGAIYFNVIDDVIVYYNASDLTLNQKLPAEKAEVSASSNLDDFLPDTGQ